MRTAVNLICVIISSNIANMEGHGPTTTTCTWRRVYTLGRIFICARREVGACLAVFCAVGRAVGGGLAEALALAN